MSNAPGPTMLYAGGPLYPTYQGKPPFDIGQLVENLTGSFSTLIAYTLHAAASGDLVYNDSENLLVSKGVYVGDSGFPGVFQTLKEQAGIQRFLFCFQGSLDRIKELGTGPESPLYQNFFALKSSFPLVVGIDLDFEVPSPDQETLIAFATMLIEIGWQITFSTGGQDLPSYSACFATLFQKYPQAVTRFHLQSYYGDDGEVQSMLCLLQKELSISQEVAATFVYPGLANRSQSVSFPGNCPDEVQSLFLGWSALGVRGGFIYIYDSIINNLDQNLCSDSPATCQAYAQSIRDGIVIPEKVTPVNCSE